MNYGLGNRLYILLSKGCAERGREILLSQTHSSCSIICAFSYVGPHCTIFSYGSSLCIFHNAVTQNKIVLFAKVNVPSIEVHHTTVLGINKALYLKVRHPIEIPWEQINLTLVPMPTKAGFISGSNGLGC